MNDKPQFHSAPFSDSPQERGNPLDAVTFNSRGQVEPATDGNDSEACIAKIMARYNCPLESALETMDDVTESTGGKSIGWGTGWLGWLSLSSTAWLNSWLGWLLMNWLGWLGWLLIVWLSGLPSWLSTICDWGTGWLGWLPIGSLGWPIGTKAFLYLQVDSQLPLGAPPQSFYEMPC